MCGCVGGWGGGGGICLGPPPPPPPPPPPRGLGTPAVHHGDEDQGQARADGQGDPAVHVRACFGETRVGGWVGGWMRKDA